MVRGKMSKMKRKKHGRRPLPAVIVIGGSDPSGGAGIQADLFTLNQLGVRAFSVITAVTAQTEKTFSSWEGVSIKNFRDQLNSLGSKAKGAVVKIGMVGKGRLIPPLASWLKKVKPSFIILDPILRSSTGYRLLDEEGLRLLQPLFSHVDLLIPNVSEAQILSGMKIKNLADLEKAGKKIKETVKNAVLMKGGHLKGPAVDLLLEGERANRFGHKRIPGPGAHGTGCTLASAIAGYLCLGNSLPQAVKKARKIVLGKLREARGLR